jgi:hypothetical protein
MSVGVDVDLGSAVISYRPAAGEERSLPTQRVSSGALFDGVPWRMFGWYFGQRHYSGTWWSATMRDHVIYESRLELSRLLLADFDPDVRRIAAQPFMLTAMVDGRPRRHILDYLWDTVDGPVMSMWSAPSGWHIRMLWCCASGLARSQTRLPGTTACCQNRRRCDWTTCVFLAGYRRSWLINANVLREMRSRTTDLIGLSVADAERELAAHPQPLVRAALMHLLWCHDLEVDPDKRLRPSTVLEAPR